MTRHPFRDRCAILGIAAVALTLFLTLPPPVRAESTPGRMPAPALDETLKAGSGLQTAIFSGGCFWGVQAVFEHVKGVTQAVSGYTGGHAVDPSYEEVSSGTTGDAESVRVTFDPAQISYGKLLQIFFSVALDPTEVGHQGPDWGSQYRSELFVNGAEQARIAHAYVAQLEAAHVFRRPIATRIDPAGPFYPAEAYHQDFLFHNPDNPYIVINDMPKLDSLKALFPESWRATPVLVSNPDQRT
jgi:peptide-methionine (S)-S-oxide reductase